MAGVPTSVTKVTNCNLKTALDPAQHYFQYDLQRPTGALYGSVGDCTYVRTFSFKITGTFERIKNIRIVASGEVGTTRVNYGLRETYVQPSGSSNEFGRTTGAYDGSLIPITGDLELHPLVHRGSSLSAPVWERELSYDDSVPTWTQYLLLQCMAHPSDFDDVENLGLETITLLVDEMEI